MACRSRPHEATSHLYNIEAVDCGIVELNSAEVIECSHYIAETSWGRRLDADPKPAVTSMSTAGRGRAVTNNINICGNGNRVYVQAEADQGRRLDSNPEPNIAAGSSAGAVTNNINIYGNQNAVLVQIKYSYDGTHENENSDSFEVSKPQFQLITSVTGVDFGKKVVKRRYKAEKHVDRKHNLVTYSQVGSTAQSLAHGLTLNLSSQRATLVIILLDKDLLQQFADEWPSQLHLPAVETLLHKLGASFECAREKVKKDRFSLYLFAIKKRGDNFSEQCFQTWIRMCYWAHHLPPSASDNVNDLPSVLTSPQVLLENGVKASLLLLGALG